MMPKPSERPENAEETGQGRAAPDWFTRAVETRGRPAEQRIGGVTIRSRSWGRDPRRTVVLVHGGAANSHWWDHIAPSLTGSAQIVALDLSGHGDSDRREQYSLDQWAAEALGALDLGDTGAERILVGHSLGGYVCLRAAILRPEAVDRVIVIDSPVKDLTASEQDALRTRNHAYPAHPDRRTAERRFSPRPVQPNALPYIVDHLASRSVTETADGWTWKFDPRVFDRDGLTPSGLSRVDVPITIVRAGHGMLTAAMAERMRVILGPQTRIVELPDAGHHVMLDRPAELVELLRATIGE